MFNPSLHTATNKSIGLTNKPVDARTYYYDEVNFVYRQYVSTGEVLAYLIGNHRVGQFSIIVNTGGSIITDGTITGGTNTEWWFKDGILDANLIIRGGGGDSFLNPTALTPYNTGTALPLTITSFQVNYSGYGTYPTIMAFYTDTGEEIVNKTVIRTPLLSPTTVTINAGEDGTGHTDGPITIVIKK